MNAGKLAIKISFIVQIFLLLCFSCSLASGAENQNDTLALNDLLQQVGEVDGWLPDGEPNYAAGEDLFLLIDGGADIYHEYGFKEAIFQTYSTKDGRSINCEIYKMDSPEAAFGIYSFKRGKEGRPIEVGHEGWFESYYLNFWKGNFLITIIGLDMKSKTVDGITKIARAFDAKIQAESQLPLITSYLPSEKLQPNGIAYLKGNLGLLDHYIFDTKNVFALKEGAVGRYDDHSIFIFQYENNREAKKWYESVKNHLQKSERFTNFTKRDAHFEVTDRQIKRISIKHYRKWILIILGTTQTKTDQIFHSIEAKISPSSSHSSS